MPPHNNVQLNVLQLITIMWSHERPRQESTTFTAKNGVGFSHQNRVLFDIHQKTWNYTFIWVVMYHWIWWISNSTLFWCEKLSSFFAVCTCGIACMCTSTFCWSGSCLYGKPCILLKDFSGIYTAKDEPELCLWDILNCLTLTSLPQSEAFSL